MTRANDAHFYIEFLAAAQQRRKLAAKRRRQGWTLDQIARELGVTRQRVHQILRTAQ